MAAAAGQRRVDGAGIGARIGHARGDPPPQACLVESVTSPDYPGPEAQPMSRKV